VEKLYNGEIIKRKNYRKAALYDKLLNIKGEELAMTQLRGNMKRIIPPRHGST
jgi:hypothetical protein